MPEKRTIGRGMGNAGTAVLRVPVLILFVCAVAAFTPGERPPAQAQPESKRILSIREDLAAVQMELMQVMRTDPLRTSFLEQREKQLKYALRTAQMVVRNAALRNAPMVTPSASASMAASSASRRGPRALSPEPKQPQSTCRPSA